MALKFCELVGDASKFTDCDARGNCTVTKMVALRDKIQAHDEKVIVFTDKNSSLLPLISEWLEKWGITHVCYHGKLTDKQKQNTIDTFRTDPKIKVFLSSDSGSDSIDLPEANLTIHYDGPWDWVTLKQRENRQDRIDSLMAEVQTITLAVPNTVEDRKAEVVATKKGYHDQIFNGAIADQAEEMRRGDYLYILTGVRSGD